MASHSNVRSLYNRSRNLTDEQLIKLKEAGGYIGIFTNGNFVSQDNPYISYDKRENNFLKHLDYLINNIGFDINKIILSTDDMNYYPDNSYHNLEVIPIENVACRLFDIISSRYGEDVARKIIRENASAIINKVSKL
jgi:membrane dipeptidase